MAIIENKNLKTSSNRRRIEMGVNCPLSDGLVTVMPQKEFESYREKYQKLKNDNGELIEREELEQLEEKIHQLQDENLHLKSTLQSKDEEIENLNLKLNEEQSKDIVKDISSIYDDRIADLKEDIQKKEREAQVSKDELDSLRASNQKEIDSLRAIKENEISSLRKEKDEEISILRSEIRRIEKEKGTLKTNFAMLLRDYQGLLDKTLVRLFYRKNDKLEEYENFLKSKSLETKETYALPMEKEE